VCSREALLFVKGAAQKMQRRCFEGSVSTIEDLTALEWGDLVSDGLVEDEAPTDPPCYHRLRMNVTVEQFESEPGEYLRRVIEGETVVVYHDGLAVAEIRPITEARRLRPIGLARGEFVVPDDFDDPLPDDILAAFEGR
jgi:antitoxin (DNA-binding transcriptional repressor) of toxin-antitoxin stability system